MLNDPELAAYRWIITKDRLCPNADDPDNEKGVEGPSNLDPTLGLDSRITERSHFALYDDDNICYYQGMIYGDFTGFEPLDDFGRPNAGCTAMKLDGEWL